MALQSLISLTVVGLVIARAVNVFSQIDGGPGRQVNWVELLATLLLAVAAVDGVEHLPGGWRGEQVAETAKATAARIESSEAATQAGQPTQIDIATFTQWVDATVAGNAELAGFYEQRFREEFQTAFDAWQATQPLTNPDAPLTLCAREYKLADADRAARLNREAGVRSTPRAWRTSRRTSTCWRWCCSRRPCSSPASRASCGPAPRELLLGLGGAVWLGAASGWRPSSVSFTRTG